MSNALTAPIGPLVMRAHGGSEEDKKMENMPGRLFSILHLLRVHPSRFADLISQTVKFRFICFGSGNKPCR